MIDKILPFLNRAIPTYFGLQGLSNLDPRMKRFITGAIGAGYTADSILGYIRNQFTAPAVRDQQNQLEQRASSGKARADELADLQQIQKQQKREGAIESGITTGAALLGGAALAGGLGGAQAAAQSPAGMAESPREVVEGQTLNQEELAPQTELIGDQFKNRIITKSGLNKSLPKLLKKGASQQEVLSHIKKKVPMDVQEYIRNLGYDGTPGNLDQRLLELAEPFVSRGEVTEPQMGGGRMSPGDIALLQMIEQMKRTRGG